MEAEQTVEELQKKIRILSEQLRDARHETQRALLDSQKAAERAEYDRHMGWNKDFDPHDPATTRIAIADCSVSGLTLQDFNSRFARQVFSELHQKLARDKFMSMDKRRERILAAYKKIAKSARKKMDRKLLRTKTR